MLEAFFVDHKKAIIWLSLNLSLVTERRVGTLTAKFISCGLDWKNTANHSQWQT
jgi:hypothetical protein